MSYLENKVDFLVKQAKLHCGTEATDFDLPQMIANDVLGCLGLVFARRDHVLLKKMAELLSIMPLLKKDATGIFLEKIQQMEDACLSIQIALREKDKKETSVPPPSSDADPATK